MHKTTRTLLDNLTSKDRQLQWKSFDAVIKETDKPVAWAYEVWDEMVALLTSPDNHDRAIGAQVLCNLAKSDPKNRMKKTFPALLEVTRDERFVTARHCLQNLYKIGIAGKAQQKMVLDGLSDRFHNCAREKNCTLIRYDIQVNLRHMHDSLKDESIKKRALELIKTEPDPKYVKKYRTVWSKK